MPRENSIKRHKEMDVKNFGTIAICGITGYEVRVGENNCLCQCLNCDGCNENNKLPCKWRYVLETNPCDDQDITAIMCNACRNATQNKR